MSVVSANDTGFTLDFCCIGFNKVHDDELILLFKHIKIGEAHFFLELLIKVNRISIWSGTSARTQILSST